MTTCTCCAYEKVFDRDRADEDIERYEAEGLPETTSVLVRELVHRGVQGKTVLDIGGGIGMISLELLAKGAAHAVNSEVSAAYVAAAQKLADERGVLDQMTFHTGDFAETARNIEPVDIVTLDKSLCCYADMETLVGLSAARAREFYALIYPRDLWWVKLAVWLDNLVPWLKRLPRNYVHSVVQVERMLTEKGFRKDFTFYKKRWQVVIFAKNK